MKPAGIIIHCSDSPQGRGDTAATIHAWHLARGWSGCGYQYVILEDGTIENGRPEYWQGSHARGYNNYIGICYIGDIKPTEEQYNSLESLITKSMQKYNFKVSDIMGHNEVSNKTCPNFNVKRFLKLRKIENVIPLDKVYKEIN